MKLNPVNFLIALGLSALIAFGFWSFGSPLRHFVGVGSFVFLAGTLVPFMGMAFDLPRRAVNLRLVCALFFFVGLVINGCSLAFDLSATFYVIASAVAFLIYAFVANAVYSARQ